MTLDGSPEAGLGAEADGAPARGCDDGRGLGPEEALRLLLDGVTSVGGSERVALSEALGRVIAVPVTAPMPLPPFDHAAVDGFGLQAADLGRVGTTLGVHGRAAAGHPAHRVELLPGRALRLLTGAAVPAGVATIVMEEQVARHGEGIALRRPLPAGANIRRQGEDVGQGQTLLQAGTALDARHLALLAAAGLVTLEVRRRLRVALLSTGDELRTPGEPLDPGMVYDANRPMLRALLAYPQVALRDLGSAPDEPARLASVLAEAAASTDLVVSTGGVSGSDADHLLPALVAAGGRGRALRLALKPGKPLVTGRLGSTSVLALPGNPVAAFTHLLLFGRPLLQCLTGRPAALPAGMAARAAAPIAHRPGRRELLPAALAGEGPDGLPLLTAVGRGGSARLRPLSLADGLAEIAATEGDLAAGDRLRFHPFATAMAL